MSDPVQETLIGFTPNMENIALLLATTRPAREQPSDYAIAQQTWHDILSDLSKGGPIARLILKNRTDAIAALAEAINVDLTSPTALTDLAEIQSRFHRFRMLILDLNDYRQMAEAEDAEKIVYNDEQRGYMTSLTTPPRNPEDIE